jgi:TM2 domain-containing membrane protein YozV
MHHSSSSRVTTGVSSRLAYSMLSAVIPGTGQIMAGYRRRGIVMLVVTCLLVVAGILIYQQGLSTIISWLVQPRFLVTIFVANVVVSLFRIGAVIDAYFTPCRHLEAPDRKTHNTLALLALVLVLAFTVVPHVVLGYYTYITHDTLNTVFSSQNLTNIQTPEATPVPENTGS